MDPTTRRRFVQLAGATTLGALAGCSAQADSPTPEPSPTPTAAATATPTPATADAAVEIAMITDNRGSYFQPKGLLVEPGTTLRFVNESGVHTATAYHPDNGDLPLRIPAGAEPFDSGILTEPGATYEVTADVPGVCDFVCVPHESLGMVGRLVVGDVDEGGPGTTEPTGLPPLARETLPSIDTVLADGVVDGP